MASMSDSSRKSENAKVAVETDDVPTQTGEHTSIEQRNVSPAEEKDQAVPASKTGGIDGPVIELLRDILEAVQDSSIAGPTAGKDNRSRFWGKYKRVAEEHDSEFLERYSSDMDIVLIFAGLFSAVSTSFIVAMEPSLLPDPSDTTNSLLLQIVQILGNSTTPGHFIVPTMPVFAGPSRTDVWVQTIAYLSLASSLLAAFGAVLGKQWLGYYKSSRYGRGSLEERGIRRQKKFNGLQTWYFDAILQTFPLLIQFSLLLFGVALSGHMWSEQRTIASVIVGTTAFGVLFYLFTLFASLLSTACPFQSPLSTLLRVLRSYIFLTPIERYHILQKVRPSHIYMACAHQFQASRRHLGAKLSIMKSVMRRFIGRLILSRPSPNDIEQGFSTESLRVSPDKDDAAAVISLALRDKTPEAAAAPSILWLLETSTDPEVLLAASRMVPEVDWQADLDFSTAIDQLETVASQLIRQKNSDALAYHRARLYLFWVNKQSYFDKYIGFACIPIDEVRKEAHLPDIFDILDNLDPRGIRPDSAVPRFLSIAQEQDMLQALHLLPYQDFKFESVDEYLQSPLRSLALDVVSNFLDGRNGVTRQSPGVADCAMVICRLLGLQFDLKDKGKRDKSSALTTLLSVMYTRITAVLDRDHQDTRKGPFREHISTPEPDDSPAELNEHIAMDCLPAMSSLLPMIFWDPSHQCSLMDCYLFICKVYFDRAIQDAQEIDQSISIDAFRGLGSRSKHFSCLQASIRSTVKAIQKGASDDIPGIERRLAVWNKRKNPWCDLKEAEHNHSWLLDYMEHICTTFRDDSVPDLEDALLVSNYALADLQNSPSGIRSYLATVTFCMGADSDELRRTALRAICAKQDILLSAAASSVPGWDAVFTTFLATLVACLPPGKGEDNSKPDTENRHTISDTIDQDLEDCTCRYLKLIFTLSQVEGWHAWLIQYGHLKASISFLTPDLMQTYPLLICLCALIILRISKSLGNPTAAHALSDVKEDAFQSIVTKFWVSLTSTDFLVEIRENEWSEFTDLLPDILPYSEDATSVNVVESILLNIPDARVGILRKQKGTSEILLDQDLNHLREILERRRQVNGRVRTIWDIAGLNLCWNFTDS